MLVSPQIKPSFNSNIKRIWGTWQSYCKCLWENKSVTSVACMKKRKDQRQKAGLLAPSLMLISPQVATAVNCGLITIKVKSKAAFHIVEQFSSAQEGLKVHTWAWMASKLIKFWRVCRVNLTPNEQRQYHQNSGSRGCCVQTKAGKASLSGWPPECAYLQQHPSIREGTGPGNVCSLSVAAVTIITNLRNTSTNLKKKKKVLPSSLVRSPK